MNYKQIPTKAPRFDECETLLCPNCNHYYTWQDRVEIFDRAEDSERGMHVTVDGCAVTTDLNMMDNPSPRRHGLRIHLSCEGCDKKSFMDIIQHKGCTQISVGVFPDDQSDAR